MANAIAMLERCGKYQNPAIQPEYIPSGASEWHYSAGEDLAPSDTGRDDVERLEATFWA